MHAYVACSYIFPARHGFRIRALRPSYKWYCNNRVLRSMQLKRLMPTSATVSHPIVGNEGGVPGAYNGSQLFMSGVFDGVSKNQSQWGANRGASNLTELHCLTGSPTCRLRMEAPSWTATRLTCAVRSSRSRGLLGVERCRWRSNTWPTGPGAICSCT